MRPFTATLPINRRVRRRLQQLAIGVALLTAAGALAACNGGVPIFSSATPSLPAPQVTIIAGQDPNEVAGQFLAAWNKRAFDAMYALVSAGSRSAISAEDFTARYEDFRRKAAITQVRAEILTTQVNSPNAEVSTRISYTSGMAGEFSREMILPLVMEGDTWRIVWDDGLILPELKGGGRLVLEADIPARGTIYDRYGDPLAYESETLSLGIVPGEIVDEESLLRELSRLLLMNTETIRLKYANALPDWYVPLGEVSRDEVGKRYGVLSGMGGIRISSNEGRTYYGGGIASHVIGYVAQVPKEQLDDYLAKGYLGDELVGVQGLEQWGESSLAGTHGGTLYVVAADGRVLSTLAQRNSQPAYDIYTTLDRDLQAKVERYAFGHLTGAAVVLNRETGEVLAMVSSPGFDSNLFNGGNFNSQYLLPELLNDQRVPLLNRATQGQYALGSVFKLITIGGALQSGAYTAASTYTCDGFFRELPGLTLEDWTVAKDKPPHGTLNLVQGLIHSCNPFFWHIGLDLFNRDPWIVPNMARGYGLGKLTGIGVIEEEPGFIPDPAWKADQGEPWVAGDAVNMAIGQVLQVTPLQVADFAAALGNGGTLYRPQLVQSIQQGEEPPVFAFTPEVRGRLPLSAENLAVIQEGMRGVTNAPGGTARATFYGWRAVAGKTGTAQDLPRTPHAWFTGYTFLERSDKPDIAIAVIAENAGEGSEIAAPIFRRILEIYFYSSPQTLYRWESAVGGPTVTPTLPVTETPGG